MRPGRLLALIVGLLLLLPAVAMLIAGGGVTTAYFVARDDDGFFHETIDDLATNTVAVTVEDLDFLSDAGSSDWVLDALDADVRLRATGLAATDDIFVGIARERDVDDYLAGVAHAEIVEMDGKRPIYQTRPGSDSIDSPADQDFWVESSAGPGTQEVIWEATGGRWAAVVMNADGAPGVEASVNAGARTNAVLAVAIGLLIAGAVFAALAVALIIVASRGQRTPPDSPTSPPSVPPPSTQPLAATTAPAATATAPATDTPVHLAAELDPELSRWMWLVKWFLAIPHFVLLVCLWIAFVVTTVAAGIAILFTGRYPRSIFDFNVGVLRWSWRVQFYAGNGGIGSDRYPPFSLQPEPSDAATLDVRYPEQLSRPLVLVKWLLALPHLIIVALLVGSTVRWLDWGGDSLGFDLGSGGGLLGMLTLVAGLVLLFTNRYPPALFEFIVGLNRWVYRVVAYVALMTDDYPPFRLDQGGADTTPRPDAPPPRPMAPDLGRDIDVRETIAQPATETTDPRVSVF